MKNWIIIPLAVMVLGCSGDLITLAEDEGDSEPSSHTAIENSDTGKTDDTGKTTETDNTGNTDSDETGTTGETGSTDSNAGTTFSKLITVRYSNSGATVTGDDNSYVTVSGGNVTVKDTGTDKELAYKLTGSTSNGSFKFYSSRRQTVLLSDVSITNANGAAINIQSGKRTSVIVEGTNTLSDGTAASYSTTGSEDMKAVLFCEGPLVFSGTGALTVNAVNKQGKDGIVSDDNLGRTRRARQRLCPGLRRQHNHRRQRRSDLRFRRQGVQRHFGHQD